MWTLNDSKIAISEFDDLNHTVIGVMTNIMALNGSVIEALSDCDLLKRSNSEVNKTVIRATTNIGTLNDSITNLLSDSVALKGSNSKLNDTIMTVALETADLKVSVSELNDSQLVSSSMIPDWPDAIACNLTRESTSEYYIYIGVAIHYIMLVSKADPHWYSDPVKYSWVQDDYAGQYGTSIINFERDGSYADHTSTKQFVSPNCDGKSIQQLSDEGLTFNFIATSKH